MFLNLCLSPQPNASSDTLQSITSGDWDVTQVLAYNEDRQLMYVKQPTHNLNKTKYNVI